MSFIFDLKFFCLLDTPGQNYRWPTFTPNFDHHYYYYELFCMESVLFKALKCDVLLKKSTIKMTRINDCDYDCFELRKVLFSIIL